MALIESYRSIRLWLRFLDWRKVRRLYGWRLPNLFAFTIIWLVLLRILPGFILFLDFSQY